MSRAAVVAAVAPLVLCAIGALPSARAQEPIRIGVLLTYTGALSVQGTDTTHGMELYLANHGAQAGGRAVQLVKEDDEGKPDVALTKIKKLVERDHCDFLVGPVNSVVALAIRNYVHEQGVPLVVPVAFTRVLTSPQHASPAIFRVAETSDQANYPMGGWMIKHTKYRRLVVMATDFVAGHHAVEAFMASFRAAGGEIVKELYAPLNTPDFAPYLAQAQAQAADAVYAFFPGADAIRFVKQYREYGLWDKMALTGYNVLTDDTILPQLGDTALGIVTISGYTAAIDTPENKAFVGAFDRAYKTWPSRYAESGWVTTALITTAVDMLKGDLRDRTSVRQALFDTLPRVKAPRGPLKFDPYRQVISDVYITKTERQGGRIVNAVLEKIPSVSQEATWGWWNKR